MFSCCSRAAPPATAGTDRSGVSTPAPQGAGVGRSRVGTLRRSDQRLALSDTDVAGRVVVRNGDLAMYRCEVRPLRRSAFPAPTVEVCNGDAEILDRCGVVGGVDVTNGDLRIRRASIAGCVTVTNGNLELMEGRVDTITTVNGSIVVDRGHAASLACSNGSLVLRNGSRITGDVQAGSARAVAVEHSFVKVLDTIGETIVLGEGARVNLLRLRLATAQAARAVAQADAQRSADPPRAPTRVAADARTEPNLGGVHRPSAFAQVGPSVQHVALYPGSILKRLEFDAQSCVLRLHPGAHFVERRHLPGLRIVPLRVSVHGPVPP